MAGGRIYSPTQISLSLLLLVLLPITQTVTATRSCAPPPPPNCLCSPPSPPPPPAEPQPSDFPNLKQYEVYRAIQRFKLTVTCDPQNATATWVGDRPCNYTGFYCDTPPDSPGTPTIAAIDFNGFGLCAPTISGFIDRLPDLALFHANSNKFTGDVPDLTSLRYLYELDLSNNLFSGQFPAAVLPLNNLSFLDLRFNGFSGTVPTSVFKLDLEVLFLNNNNFAQQLPAEVWRTPVAYLTLANNRFTGPIPTYISNASLIEILLLNNRLSGCLPYEVGLLNEATVFDAGFNRITGPIPLSFGCLSKMEELNLAGNLLYGEVPDVLCRLAEYGQLTNLSLSGNYFTSLGHECWPLIQSGVLDVKRNCIPGCPYQRPAGECLRFFWHPLTCPYHAFVPCELPPTASFREAGNASAPQRRLTAARTYTAYAALRRPEPKP